MGYIAKRYEWVYQLFIVREIQMVVRNGNNQEQSSSTKKWQRVLHYCKRLGQKSYKRSINLDFKPL